MKKKVSLYSYREQQKKNMEYLLDLGVKVFAGVLVGILLLIILGAVIF